MWEFIWKKGENFYPSIKTIRGSSINDVTHFLRFFTSPCPLSPILIYRLMELLDDPPPNLVISFMDGPLYIFSIFPTKIGKKKVWRKRRRTKLFILNFKILVAAKVRSFPLLALYVSVTYDWQMTWPKMFFPNWNSVSQLKEWKWQILYKRISVAIFCCCFSKKKF